MTPLNIEASLPILQALMLLDLQSVTFLRNHQYKGERLLFLSRSEPQSQELKLRAQPLEVPQVVYLV
jgi:hypothetical protein